MAPEGSQKSKRNDSGLRAGSPGAGVLVEKFFSVQRFRPLNLSKGNWQEQVVWRRYHFPPGRGNCAFKTVKTSLLYCVIVPSPCRMGVFSLLGHKAQFRMLVRKKNFLGTRRLSGTFPASRRESPHSQTSQQTGAAVWPRPRSGFCLKNISERIAPRRCFSDFNVPPSAEFVARPVGVCSAFKLPIQTSVEGLDAAFVGVPLDTGTSNRPGAR